MYIWSLLGSFPSPKHTHLLGSIRKNIVILVLAKLVIHFMYNGHREARGSCVRLLEQKTNNKGKSLIAL